MPVLLRLMPGEELTKVADALRAIDATFPGKLRRRMKREVKDVVSDVKTHVRTIPVDRKSTRNKGLRRQIARGVSVHVATGGRTGFSRMRIVTTMPLEKAITPRGLDRFFLPHKGWRHPVFQRPTFEMRAQSRKVQWVRQTTPQSGWFMREIASHSDEIADGLTEVLEEARNVIARAASTAHTVQLPESWQ